MFGHFGLWELLLILAILLVIFGTSRIGDLGSSLGKAIRGFRESLKDEDSQDKDTEQSGAEPKN